MNDKTATAETTTEDKTATTTAATTTAADDKSTQTDKTATLARPETTLSTEAAEKTITATADFPDDWREKLAGGDEKKLTQLKRYTSPKAWTDATFALRQKMDAGEIKASLPENATPEQVAEWRKTNGIPVEPKDYFEADAMKGLVVGEKDKPVIDEFVSTMHEKNAKPEHVRSALDFYHKTIEARQAEQATKDAVAKENAEEALRSEWGGEFKGNKMAVANLISTMPEGVQDKFMFGRLADGTPLTSDPDVIRWLANIAKEQNPAATIVPNNGGNQMQGVEEEIKKIETTMRTDRRTYDKDAKMQARYLELLTAREKLTARGKAA
jgi:hypothetical protein